MTHIGMADVLRGFARYDTAESYAYQFKGDTKTDQNVHVVEDFEPHWPMMCKYPTRFLVVLGDIEESDRYEIQYTA